MTAAEDLPAATETPDPPEVPEPGPEADDEQDGGQDDTPGTLAKARKQAASYRERLRASETEVTAQRTRADQAETQLLDLVLGQAGLDRRLWTASGTETPRAEDGSVDVAATLAAAEQVRAEFGVARSPQPNPQQGQPPGGKPQRGLADAFKPNPPRR